MSESPNTLSEPEETQGSRGAEEQGSVTSFRGEISPLPLRSPAPLHRHPQNNIEIEAETQEQPAPLRPRSPAPLHSTNILWREWRNTGDEEYAEHLFNLIADEPVGQTATFINAALGIFYGGLIGLLISLWGNLGDSFTWTQTWSLLAGTGAALGGVLGALSRLLKPKLSWRNWLFGLTQGIAPSEMGLWIVALALALFGSQLGWMMGRSAGLEHTIGFVGLGVVTTLALGIRLVGWLIGLMREPDPRHLHRYRALWFWWRQRPQDVEVEAALRQVCERLPESEKLWTGVLQNLERRAKEPDTIRELIIHLQSLDWVERFTARQLLVAYGGEAVDELQALANKITSPLRKTAVRLLQGIEQETTARLAHRTGQLLCRRCLAFFCDHSVSALEDSKIAFYGCRMCRQSREFWEGEVVVVLDAGMGVEPIHQNGTTRINWLAQRELFDFHSVEIVRATDEDVERFAVQVGNDTAPFRQPRYRQMRCVVAPECGLSENSLRILGSIFGEATRQ